MDDLIWLENIREAVKASKREFDVEHILGTGNFRKVVKAKCTKEGVDKGKQFAIKILTYDVNDRDRLEYQEREIESLYLLNNSNVIKYFDSWIMQVGDKRKLCIQMELCSANLKKFVDNPRGTEFIQSPGWPRFYQQIVKQILNGLVAIHKMEWIHRDIHPGNIFVVNQNPQQIRDIHVKIGDLGLARPKDRIKIKISPGWTVKPEELLTPFSHDGTYMAPELKKKEYDLKVDVYSVGVVLYFISRYPVLESSELKKEIKAIRRGEHDINEHIYHKDDEKLVNLIRNLLQENPKARFSAKEAMHYMFPTEADNSTDVDADESMRTPQNTYSIDNNESVPISQEKYSADSSKALKTEFIARKENEKVVSQCFLNEFTLSAMKAEVERRTRVKADRQVLRQERMIDGEMMRIKIEEDEDVENIFKIAAEKNV